MKTLLNTPLKPPFFTPDEVTRDKFYVVIFRENLRGLVVNVGSYCYKNGALSRFRVAPLVEFTGGNKFGFSSKEDESLTEFIRRTSTQPEITSVHEFDTLSEAVLFMENAS